MDQKKPGGGCFQRVNNFIDEIEVDIPETVIERAYRIGKVIVINGRKAQQIRKMETLNKCL